jgi:hypothetical protein
MPPRRRCWRPSNGANVTFHFMQQHAVAIGAILLPVDLAPTRFGRLGVLSDAQPGDDVLGIVAEQIARALAAVAAMSSGLYSLQVCNERLRSRCSSEVVPRPLEQRDAIVELAAPRPGERPYRAFVGARSGGSVASASATSSSDRPIRCAIRMDATRWSTCRG